MVRYINYYLVVLCLSLSCNILAQEIPLAPPPKTLPDKADLVPWPLPGYPVFDKQSLGNLQNWLLDKPAGKHGYVKVLENGQLAFEDGTPANFWGTTTAYGMTFPEKRSEIPLLADAIASRGYNLVRFHHNDMAVSGLGFLQTSPKSNYLLDKQGMDRLDYFAAELIKRGVYIYLDLIDYRTFKPEDGFDDYNDLNKLGNHGWKGVFPHPNIVKAWKRTVKELLNHKNPYTGKTWGEDPAIVSIEIINENGPFWDWSFQVTDKIHKWYDQQWNKWLLEKYKTREALDAAWTNKKGTKGLFKNEDPAKGNIFRPRLGKLDTWDRSYRSKTSGAARINDYYKHLSEITINFYQDAKQYIRNLGFKGVVIGSHELRGPLNRYAEYKGTGAVAAHLYGFPLIAWKARPGSSGIKLDGVDVKAKNWFSNMPRIKVKGAPSINGEWTAQGFVYHADGNLAIAAATAFQRVTQSCHFTYGSRWRKVKMANFNDLYKYRHHLKKIAFSFSYHHEIPWMIVNRICAPLFIRRDFAKPKHTVNIAYSKADLYEQNLHALGISGGSGTIGGAANFLPLIHNVECVFFDEQYEGDADVVFMTGRSSSGDYSKAKHAVLIGDNPYCDPQHKTRDIGYPAKQVNPSVKIVTIDQPVEFKCTWPWNKEKILNFKSLEGAVELSSIPKGAQHIGISSDGKYTLGWLDDRFLVMPNGKAFQDAANDKQWLYRMYISACQRWGISTGGNRADSHAISSDTGEMMVDWGYGTLQIDTQKTQGFSGLAGWRKENKTSALECNVENPYANILATSTDNAALINSENILLVAVGRMQNTGQKLGKNKFGKDVVAKVGKAPCLVEAIRGTVELKTNHADSLNVYALDHTGKRKGIVKHSVNNGSISFQLSPEWATVWFEISTNATPVETAANWPKAITPTPNYTQPKLILLQKYFNLINVATVSKPKKVVVNKKGFMPIQLKSFSSGKSCHAYGNAKAYSAKDAANKFLKAQFGKVNRQWFGGIWGNMSAMTHLQAKDIVGIGLDFKGDGTKPRDAYLYLSTTNGGKYKSININTIFEDDKWKDIILSADQFTIDPGFAKKKPEKAKLLPSTPDFSTVNRFDFVCVGPLMDQQSIGYIKSIFLALNKAAFKAMSNPFKLKLPQPTTPSTRTIAIPFVKNAKLVSNGVIDETDWQKSIGITMDEDKVPEWHFYGSHIVDGKHTQKQKADFWLLATPQGLAIIAKIITGNPDVIAENEDWWKNDCLEIFTDVENKAGKPTKQLFLAFKQSGANLPAASCKYIKLGRAKLKDGYLLETLIPWENLGFKSMPESTFGLEFQLDFAQPGKGRVLQMCYGTGTNEAWIKSDQYLKCKIVK